LASAIKGYESDLKDSPGSAKVVSGVGQDRWESGRYLMVSYNQPLTNEKLREACYTPEHLAKVPLEEGQSLAPDLDFRVYREGRSCYEASVFGQCQKWIYHGVYACFYYFSKAPQK
jgi:hypothetical protein